MKMLAHHFRIINVILKIQVFMINLNRKTKKKNSIQTLHLAEMTHFNSQVFFFRLQECYRIFFEMLNTFEHGKETFSVFVCRLTHCQA